MNLLKAVTPAEERTRFNYKDVILTNGEESYQPLYIHLSVIFSNNQDQFRYFFSKKELKFGIGYEISNARSNYKTFDSIRLAQYPMVSARKAYMEYAYQCQYILVGYQVASKPFFRYFAMFGGVDGRFGMNTYKQIQMEDYYTSLNGKVEENYNVGYFSSGIHLGLKYNFSCDLNFMVQYETGINFYGKDIGGSAYFSGAGFGMRYKIIDEQDRPKYQLMKYW